MWNAKMKKQEIDLIPFMTFIESFDVELSINVFQLFCSEKLFKTLSQKLLQ